MTYVHRQQLGLEEIVRDALDQGHAFIVISGPTKCGKSVLCRHVLAGSKQVLIQGGQVKNVGDFWGQVAYHLKLPNSVTRTTTKTWNLRSLFEVSGGLPAILQKKISVDGTSGGLNAEADTFRDLPVLSGLNALKKRDHALIIEDFHYLDAETQRSIVRALKSAVFDGLKVIILAVPHRSFDPTEVESEVEGRVRHVSIPQWSEEDLGEIARKGFEALRLQVPANVRRRICDDSFGNPLLAQQLCYQVSVARLSLPENAPPMEAADLAQVYDRVAQHIGLARFDRFANTSIDSRAPQMVDLRQGGEESLPMVLLSSVAWRGPQHVTSYGHICERFSDLSRANPPSPEEMGRWFSAMGDAVSNKPGAVLEWVSGRQELVLTDPMLMFYMRWALRDRRTMSLDASAIDNALLVQPRSEAPGEVGDE